MLSSVPGRGGTIGAMGTAALLALEQFEQLPQEDGVKYELKDGRLLRKVMRNLDMRNSGTSKSSPKSCPACLPM
jgi:hypothetical protein